jgi:hypothetical protein
MTRISMLAAGGLLMAGVLVGCQSKHESGVKSNYMTQWAPVAANTKETTEAAKEVFEEEGLKDVTAASTAVDGKARGKLADGTEVVASVKKETEATSTLSVNVGTVGDPALGADLAKKIKGKAEE